MPALVPLQVRILYATGHTVLKSIHVYILSSLYHAICYLLETAILMWEVLDIAE